MASGLATLRARPSLLRYTSLIQPRLFGSSSAVAIQYDDDDYEEYDDRTVRSRGSGDLMGDREGSRNRRGVQWVVLGQPGAKKSVYAEKLSKLLDVPHISMASLLLQELHPHSSVYQQIKNAVNQGKLVPEDIIFGLLSKRLEEGYHRGESGFILDGIPRTLMQAEVLDQIVDIDLVLNFKTTGKVERKLVNGPSIHPQVSQMKSLSEAAQREKLRTYAEQSKLLEDFYRRQKKLLDFEVDEGLDETWHDLLSVLQLQHTKSSFQKLTA
ncbi:putative adenylate kinase 7, mitochondrial [Silene latifolia]|uniref:putative adenylate kinase 7, mitochondrial n=1 Tax=Silene latifolia TaxID=37657 RepID=UPI003D78A55B